MTEFCVHLGDVVSVPSDLLLLKHAQYFYRADEVVARLLIGAGRCVEQELRQAPGDSVIIESGGAIAANRVMFLGTPPLRSFTYDEMTHFAEKAIEKIAHVRLPVRTITTTVHGTGYGLDGGESLQRLLRGFRRGLVTHPRTGIEKITFVTLGERAARMLSATLEAMEQVDDSSVPTATNERSIQSRLAAKTEPTSVKQSTEIMSGSDGIAARKRRVFVALPFSEEFQNVYEYGIYPAVRNCDLICERVDEAHFIGDVIVRIKEGIEAASLVVADLSGARPNVYLEVGYAWGRGVPVILLAQKGQQIHFDLAHHRIIFYVGFNKLAKELEELIRGIDASCRLNPA
jgi:hypothetical protein